MSLAEGHLTYVDGSIPEQKTKGRDVLLARSIDTGHAVPAITAGTRCQQFRNLRCTHSEAANRINISEFKKFLSCKAACGIISEFKKLIFALPIENLFPGNSEMTSRPNVAPELLRITDPSALGPVIRARRRAQSLRIDDAASLSGVSVDLLSRLENGKGSVRLDKLLAVLDSLGLALVLGPKDHPRMQPGSHPGIERPEQP